MRGTTVKNIKKFVKILIANTPEDQRTKTEKQMFDEVSKMWHKDPKVRKFVHKILDGEIETACQTVNQ